MPQDKNDEKLRNDGIQSEFQRWVSLAFADFKPHCVHLDPDNAAFCLYADDNDEMGKAGLNRCLVTRCPLIEKPS